MIKRHTSNRQRTSESVRRASFNVVLCAKYLISGEFLNIELRNECKKKGRKCLIATLELYSWPTQDLSSQKSWLVIINYIIISISPLTNLPSIYWHSIKYIRNLHFRDKMFPGELRKWEISLKYHWVGRCKFLKKMWQNMSDVHIDFKENMGRVEKPKVIYWEKRQHQLNRTG